MKQNVQVSEHREAIKEEITAFIENTIAARILRGIGSWIQRVTHQSSSIPWYISAFALEVLVLVPSIVAALILKDPQQVIGEGLFWSAAGLLVAAIIPLSYLSSKHILVKLRDYIIPAMKEDSEIEHLRPFLIQLADWRKPLLRGLFVSLVWLLISIPIFSSVNKGLIRVSYAFDSWLFGFLGLGVGMHYLLWFMRFPNWLKDYQYNLYQFDPSRSEIITHISNISTPPFLATAVYFAIATSIASLFEVFHWVIPMFIIGFWIPLIVNFMNTQYAVTKIIDSGKWQTLHEIQEQLHERKNSPGLNSSAEIETTNKLMDLYDRVYNARNTGLRIRSLLEFLNQLLLPLLAFLISNYDSVLNLLRLRP